MLLYIVRHAWAEERDDRVYPDDDLRPLTEKGQKRFRRLVELLVARGFDPAHVATSPLVRCRQTAEIITKLSPKRPEVTLLAELAPGAKLAPLAPWTDRHAEGDIAWVGHAPDVGELTATLIGQAPCAIRFSKGAVAALRVQGRVATGRGELCWLVNADLLGC